MTDMLAAQGAWWACLLCARAGFERAALIGPALYVAAHLLLRPALRTRLAALAAGSALLGLLVDTLLMRASALSFPRSASPLSPAWMVSLWAVFGLQLSASLERLTRAPLAAAAALGALGGPLAYRAGASLGAASLPPGGMTAVGLSWLAATPLLVLLARRTLPAAGPAGGPRP